MHWHMLMTLVCICPKTQLAAASTLHVVGIYVPETNMSGKVHIYTIYAIDWRGL